MSSRKSISPRQARALAINRRLKQLFPDAKIALKFKNTWELLVAVELSAQCTDKKVNQITAQLFKKYPTLNAYVRANPRKFERDIFACGFYRNKTKNILGAAKLVQKKFHGKIPRTMDEILTIPGVARKTANVVLGNAYGVVEGIAVDTHVSRLARKLGLTSARNPVQIERDLMELFPKSEWFTLTYRLIEYGRQICPAWRHDCRNHPLSKIFPPAARRWPSNK